MKINNFNKEIGKRIQRARKDLGMTLDDLGKRMNLNQSTIKRYEDGEIKKFDIGKIKKAIDF